MFEAVVECGSFKAASQHLNKSQPSLSVGVKKIEELYQIKLFSRDEYRPKLTQEGEIFYKKVKLALDQYRRLDKFAKELKDNPEPEIRVVIDALVPMKCTRDLLKTFFYKENSSDLFITTDVLAGAATQLSNSLVNFAIAPLFDNDPNIEKLPFTHLTMVPVIAPELYESIGNDPNKLMNIPQIVVTNSRPESKKLSLGLLESGKKWLIGDNNIKQQLIENGLGWGSLPLYAIEDKLEKNSLIEITGSPISKGTFQIYFLRNKTMPQGPLSKKIWEYVNENFPS